jgi:hypothetical protein
MWAFTIVYSIHNSMLIIPYPHPKTWNIRWFKLKDHLDVSTWVNCCSPLGNQKQSYSLTLTSLESLLYYAHFHVQALYHAILQMCISLKLLCRSHYNWPFLNWQNFIQKENLKLKSSKMKWFRRFSIARSEGKNSNNHQIFTNDFHCVAKNIKGWLWIRTPYLVYN